MLILDLAADWMKCVHWLCVYLTRLRYGVNAFSSHNAHAHPGCGFPVTGASSLRVTRLHSLQRFSFREVVVNPYPSVFALAVAFAPSGLEFVSWSFLFLFVGFQVQFIGR